MLLNRKERIINCSLKIYKITRICTKSDLTAKRLLPIQVLLMSNVHKNFLFKDINLKICL